MNLINILKELYDFDESNIAGEEIIPYRYVYHQTLPKYRDIIERNGLIPNVGESYRDFSNSILKRKYGDSDTKIIPAIFAWNVKDLNEIISKYEIQHSYLDIWRIDTHIISNKWYKDLNWDISVQSKNNKAIIVQGND